MAYADTGPLLAEHLDELELICRASSNDGYFNPGARDKLGLGDAIGDLDYVLAWHDRHDQKLLLAARWALENGWPK